MPSYTPVQETGSTSYCLELHSNKAHKLDVIKQLGNSLTVLDRHTQEEWGAEAARISSLKDKLNQYVTALHKRRGIGESVYWVTSRLVGLRNAKRLTLPLKDPDRYTSDDLNKMKDIVKQMKVAGDACNHPAGSPWTGVGLKNWGPTKQRDIEDALDRVIGSAYRLESLLQEAVQYLHFNANRWSIKQISSFSKFVDFLLSVPKTPYELLTAENWDDVLSFLNECIAHGRKRDALRQKVYESFSPDILHYEIDPLIKALQKSENQWFFPAWLSLRRVNKQICSVVVQKHPFSRSDLLILLKQTMELIKESDEIERSGKKAATLLKQLWNNGEANWDDLSMVVEWCSTFRQYVIKLAGGNPERSAKYLVAWAGLLTKDGLLLDPDSSIRKAFVLFIEECNWYKSLRKELEAKLEYVQVSAQTDGHSQEALVDSIEQMEKWKANINGLHAWCNWQMVRAAAMELQIAALVHVYERDKISSDSLMPIFERSFYQWWLESTTEYDPVLVKFFSPEHERLIREYREIDDRYMRLTRKEIQARLSSHVPVAGDRVNANSEMGILRHQMQRQRGHMPVRKLIQKIPNLLPRLKPCLLMSPISVAQYLDPSHTPFDIVVFDEASQISVWDAVGAIARGKEAVIVGDPKQLPPTTFFMRSDDQEMAEDDIVEDLESILDDCKACGLPEMQLRWHYRSRHESLIAFSNYHYYDNSLLTFPSPYRGQGVEFKYVPGKYDRGKSCTNRLEADAIVEEIIRRVTTPELATYSIGVVTFSVKQQTLIQNLLEEARSQYPEVDAAFNDDSNEPIFVKNLENVQGDERDIILFSVCYGPDEQGRVYHNFGPLARDGGHRRLNVAVTRARVGVIVFSSIRADQISLARTRARGVADLKNFLDYADKGTDALAGANTYNENAGFDSPFEKEVYEELRNQGYEVHTQIGCSGYRIDLAVVDPRHPGAYLMGIECDGANYHRAKTARDRDRLRQDILEQLGWRLYRIWSTDWWHNKQEQLTKVISAIEKAIIETPPIRNNKTNDGDTFDLRNETSKVAAVPINHTGNVLPQKRQLPIYTPHTLKFVPTRDDDFYSERNDNIIQKLLKEVVDKEGPLSAEVATKRIVQCWGLKRSTSKAVDRVVRMSKKTDIIETKSDKIFFWPSTIDPMKYSTFRIPGDSEESKRKADDLPPEEIANAAFDVLMQQVSLPRDGLLTETSRVLGYQRSGDIVAKAMSSGIDLLLKQKRASLQDEMIVLIK